MIMDSLDTINEVDNIEVANVHVDKIENISRLLKVTQRDFTIVGQNIRSVYSNFDDLQLNLALLKIEIDLIILSECRLRTDKNIPSLPHYNSFVTTNHLNRADGVVAYLKNNHRATVSEVNLTHASCLQVSLPHVTILAIYRSPSVTNANDFILSLDKYLENINNSKNIIIIGDININLICRQNEQSHERLNRNCYLNMLAMHGLLPGHSLPTRGPSCLDHIMLKLQSNDCTGTIAIADTTVTDHSMTIFKMTNNIHSNKIKKTKTKSSLNTKNALEHLKHNLPELLTIKNTNLLADMLIKTLQDCLNLHTIKRVIPLKNQMIKPWMTIGLLRCIQNRNSIQKKLKLDPYNDILKITFTRYRNYCNSLIKKFKRKYEREKLLAARKDSKKLWKAINDVTSRKQVKIQNTGLLEMARDPTEAVNKANKHFVTVGKQLANTILLRRSSQQIKELTQEVTRPTSSFVLFDTDEQEVRNVLMSLKSTSASGSDNIPIAFLKEAHEFVVPIITYLTNLCFEQGIFPSALKQALITPVYKSGDKAVIANYRPISVLTPLSKVLEKIINFRLINYLNKNNILSSSQYGFRQGMSTEDAILQLTTIITSRVDKGDKCMAVFLDLKNAFDSVSVSTLLHRLEEIGVRGQPLSIFTDYLTNRKQKVKIGDYISSEETITYGVPQGSVLGPTLFLVYINHLCNIKVNSGYIFSYADDTALLFYGDTWDSVRSNAERELSKIANWLDSNLLTLNAKKTNYICFSKYDRTQPPDEFEVKIHYCPDFNNCTYACTAIDKVMCTKYLGVMVDQRLSWHYHIELILCRIRKLMWTFKILRYVAPNDVLRQIYITLAQSVITYCLPIWGGASKIKFLDVERSQRSLLKLIYFKPYRFPTENLYSAAEVLTVRKLYVLQTILKLHKSIKFDPEIYNKRRKNVVTVIKVDSSFAARQYPRQSSYLYNLVNKEINIFPLKLSKCKRAVTDWLFTKTYDETETLIQTISPI